MGSQKTNFYSLPPEVRLQIYNICFDKRLGFQTTTYQVITLVNRQIRSEAITVLLAENRSFRTLASFFKWIARAPPHLLQYIKDIRISIEAGDLTPVEPDTDTGSSKSARARVTQWIGRLFLSRESRSTAEQEDLDRCMECEPSVEKALSALSGLQALWVVAHDRQRSPERLEEGPFQLHFLTSMSKSTPSLRSLSSFTSLIQLDYLIGLRNLRRLRWTGYSLDSPMATVVILRKLPCLDSMSLYRYPEHYDKDHGIVTAELHHFQSFNSDVLKEIRPLKFFEIRHMTSVVSSDMLTATMMDALLTTHSKTLTELQISSDSPIDQEVFTGLLKVISESEIWKLHLVATIPVQGENFNIKAFLPNSVQNPHITLYHPGQDANRNQIPY